MATPNDKVEVTTTVSRGTFKESTSFIFSVDDLARMVKEKGPKGANEALAGLASKFYEKVNKLIGEATNK
jgi:hypothetical protein